MCGASRWSSGLVWASPPPTPCCLLRRELGLGRDPYRATCLAVRSACAGRGPRQLRRRLARTDAADSEYNVDRVYLHLPAEKRVLVAPAFGPLSLPHLFRPLFTELRRKDDRCTALVERPHPYKACRPQAFSLHAGPGGTNLDVVDIRDRRVEQRVTLVTVGDAGPSAQISGRPGSLSTVKYIHHDLERNELVMTSVQTETVLASVIVFSILPFQFLVRFQVLRKVFPHVDSVTVSEGVVMMTSRAHGIVRLYSLDTILQKRSFVAGLGEEVAVDGRQLVIGQRRDGLPINGQLPADASPIATFSAYRGYLELGATPYHLVTRRKQDEGFEVRRLSDGALVLSCGALRPSMWPEAATFVDDGPYMVQHSTAELRVFDLTSGQEVLRVDPVRFTMLDSPLPKGDVTTRSGRRVRLRQPPPSLLGSEWWLAWDIEDELELMLVVIVEEVVGEAAVLRRLLLYDRHTWTLTSDTPLQYYMPLNGAGLSQVAVVMDRCLLYAKLRSSAARCATIVYNLAATADPKEPETVVHGPWH